MMFLILGSIVLVLFVFRVWTKVHPAWMIPAPLLVPALMQETHPGIWAISGILSVSVFGYIFVRRKLSHAQGQWFQTNASRMDEMESPLDGKLTADIQVQDDIRKNTSELRKQYQLVSRLARTLEVEGECRLIREFLKDDAGIVDGSINFHVGTKPFSFSLRENGFIDKGRPVSDIETRWSIPLTYGERRLGMMQLRPPPHAPGDMVDRLRVYAGQIQLTFATAVFYEEARMRAVTDALTGVAARWYFDDRLQQEILFSGPASLHFGLLMIDIDHFKTFNDTHGHEFGDDVLQGVAAAIQSSCREADLVARYGGEEFAVIASKTDTTQLSALAERLRVAVRGKTFTRTGVFEPVRVTISLGGSVWTPGCACDAGQLIQSADRNLYAAKHAGRDRWVVESGKESGKGDGSILSR